MKERKIGKDLNPASILLKVKIESGIKGYKERKCKRRYADNMRIVWRKKINYENLQNDRIRKYLKYLKKEKSC